MDQTCKLFFFRVGPVGQSSFRTKPADLGVRIELFLAQHRMRRAKGDHAAGKLVNLLMLFKFVPVNPTGFVVLSSCTSLPLNKFRTLLRLEWAPVYHVKGWGKFKQHYGDFCTGADMAGGSAGALSFLCDYCRAGIKARYEYNACRMSGSEAEKCWGQVVQAIVEQAVENSPPARAMGYA